jgi:hypothetical protein
MSPPKRKKTKSIPTGKPVKIPVAGFSTGHPKLDEVLIRAKPPNLLHVLRNRRN